MAQRTQVIYSDDLTGEAGEDISTVRFGFDGIDYEIELNEANRKELANAVEPYLTAGRKIAAGRFPGRRVRRDRAASSGARAWAREQGHTISDKGRIPVDIMTAYEASQNGGQPSTPVVTPTPASVAPEPAQTPKATRPRSTATRPRGRGKTGTAGKS